MPTDAFFSTLPLAVNGTIFALAAAVIGFAGWRLAASADILADRTGMGEAITGALFLGAATSLPGLVTSVSAAAQGLADLAVSNAVGGIAIQTVFLAVADLTYKRANLEHAAASIPSIMQGALLIIILTLPLLAGTTPEYTIWRIHPVTPLMVLTYVFGMRIVSSARNRPMWMARQTPETRQDAPDAGSTQGDMRGVWLKFVLLAASVGSAGWLIAHSGIAISAQTGISRTAVGALLTAVATSLPELVTAVAAVRQGAYTLAVSGIIGGNAFDTLFAGAADLAYREGSVYHAMTAQHVFLIVLTILMTGILLLGLLHRERRGPGNIGFESMAVLLLYVAGGVYLLLS